MLGEKNRNLPRLTQSKTEGIAKSLKPVNWRTYLMQNNLSGVVYVRKLCTQCTQLIDLNRLLIDY